MNELANKQLSWMGIGLLVMICTAACAQDRDDDDKDDDTVKTETQDKDAEKRAKKAERKSRKDKKEGKSSSGAVKLPPPAIPAEFEFFDGAIFSRKVNLGIKNVLCFASERRPLAMLWKESGQADARRGGGAATGSVPIKLTARELQLIFGRPVETALISVLNENGEMTVRGVAAQVAFSLGHQPVYLLVEVTPSRPKAASPADKK